MALLSVDPLLFDLTLHLASVKLSLLAWRSGFLAFYHAMTGSEWQLRVMGLVGWDVSRVVWSCAEAEVVFWDLCLHSNKTTAYQEGMIEIVSP